MNARAFVIVASAWLVSGCGGGGQAGEAAGPREPAAAAAGPADEPVAQEPADDPEAEAAVGPEPAEQSPVAAPPDVQAPPVDADRTSSGLASVVLRAGTGTARPNEWDKVRVHYSGWTTDGKLFDSSLTRGSPAKFVLRSVIPGWREGVLLMVVGEQRRLWIPEQLAYAGRAGAPRGMLVFDVELIEIEPGVAPVPAPADVAAPPRRARKTRSGLRYTVLQRGKKRGQRPRPADRVTVHYIGWTTDGAMFDNSRSRPGPGTFPMSGFIPGWVEGLQLMRVGDHFRFWIPEELAYKGEPGRPQGTLVFDVELIAIEE